MGIGKNAGRKPLCKLAEKRACSRSGLVAIILNPAVGVAGNDSLRVPLPLRDVLIGGHFDKFKL
jgi:hypothetical protein